MKVPLSITRLDSYLIISFRLFVGIFVLNFRLILELDDGLSSAVFKTGNFVITVEVVKVVTNIEVLLCIFDMVCVSLTSIVILIRNISHIELNVVLE